MRIRNAHNLEQSLNAAIFAPTTMKRIEHGVGANARERFADRTHAADRLRQPATGRGTRFAPSLLTHHANIVGAEEL